MAEYDLLICTRLMGETPEEMLASMGKAKEEGAHIAELKLHSIHSINDVEKVIKHRLLPLIISFSLTLSGGICEANEKKKCFEVLGLALELGAEFVDVEHEVAAEFMSGVQLEKHCNSKIIVSYHVKDRSSSKEKLGDLVAHMQSTRADIIKLVIDASVITDVAKIFHLLSQCQVPLIAFAAGDRGLISQLLCRKFGGFLVYGSIGGNSIPGLPTLCSLRGVYKLEHMNAYTKIYGVISNPVGHSKGPILHNPAFRHIGYNGIYVPMCVDDIKKFFEVYSSPDFAGFSVGIPHKEAALGCCDEVDPLAKSIGAVNTIVRRPSDRKLIGYNTDCEAAITAIEDAMRERAKSLASAVSGEARPYKEINSFCPEKRMILANATSVGMQPNSDKTPVSKEVLGAYDLVFDSVYTPRNTRLLREAEEAGAIAVSGVEMFLRQAISQFNLFTGGLADAEFMRNIVLTEF